MSEANFPDWLTAFGTVGTLAFTVGLIGVQSILGRRQNARAQAVLVSGWTDPVKPEFPTRVLTVANLSSEPVYQVNVFMQDEKSRDEDGRLYPMEIHAETINTRYMSVFPPRQHVTWHIDRAKGDPGGTSVPLVAVYFTDRRGKRWRRGFGGQIGRLKGDDAQLHRRASAESSTPPSRESIAIPGS